MYMKRLFTFGCSFTQYWRWPTWADALGQSYQHFENWGMCGAGNSYILYSLIECHQRNRITSDDDVYIMWTNTSREDRYVGDRWLPMGNVYWSDGSELPVEYVKKFACERGYLIRDLAQITAAKHILESIGCNWKFFSMVPLSKTNEHSDLGYNPADVKQNNLDVVDLYKDTLNSIQPSVFKVVFGQNWNSRPGIPDSFDESRRDFHPTPMEHLQYLDHVMPGVVTEQTTKWMEQAQHLVLSDSLNWEQSTQLPENRL